MTRHRFFQFAAAAAFGLLFGIGQAGAAGTEPEPQVKVDTDYTKAVALIKAKQYRQALPLLQKAAGKDAKNADIQNYLGYANRKLKNMKTALKYYQAALKINPKHRGANEYLGELYLETGQLAKAEQRLKVLDDACFFGCEEYTELKEKIAAYKAGRTKGS